MVVNSHNGGDGRRVYTYLRDNGVCFMQFIPMVERYGMGNPDEATVGESEASSSTGRLVSSRSVAPGQFGQFLIDVFDEWVRRDVGRVFVQVFDQALGAWCGMEPTLCVFRKQCGRALVMEHNGDIFSCDHFVDPAHKLGNLNDVPLVELANSAAQQRFGSEKELALPKSCRDCDVGFACNGECPKNRFAHTQDGEPGLNYLCAGYRAFFRHIDRPMKLMAAEIKQRRPAANVMYRLSAEGREKKTKPATGGTARTGPPTGHQPGRNDPCPCGSGKKFKRCCLHR